MSVDRSTVKRIARLARIAVPEAEVDHLVGELNGILGWVDELGQVDTREVEPMTSVVAAKLPRRADVVNDGGQQAAVLANAPAPEGSFFAVPKVVE